MGQKALLHAAWCWDCPECGEENFVRSTVQEWPPEQIEKLRETKELDDDEHGFYQSAPVEVECYNCEQVFDVWLDYPGVPFPEDFLGGDQFSPGEDPGNSG